MSGMYFSRTAHFIERRLCDVPTFDRNGRFWYVPVFTRPALGGGFTVFAFGLGCTYHIGHIGGLNEIGTVAKQLAFVRLLNAGALYRTIPQP